MEPRPLDLSGLRILVVEDTTLIADSICDELQSHGCEIVGPIGRLEHGYDTQSAIPPRFHAVERLTKPFDLDDLAIIAARRFAPR
jgi:hypothetical protein